MGCNCGKKNASASPAARRAATAASGRGAARTPVKRQVRQRTSSVARERPTATSQRPANSLVYYVIGPDGYEETYRTLAEAQTVLRRFGHGNGYKIESRRETS
jgi:hypothetical protein